MNAAEIFVPIEDMDAWEDFYAANREALDEIADKPTLLALACNCGLLVGGGAAPLFRIGFVDGESS